MNTMSCKEWHQPPECLWLKCVESTGTPLLNYSPVCRQERDWARGESLLAAKSPLAES